MHQRFIDWVRSRRGERLKPESDPELLEGKFWTGMRGIELGLVDGLGELQRTLRERYGARTRFRVLRRRQGMARRFGLVGSRSEEHTSELQSLMLISSAVFCLKKKKTNNI